jgi:hypothetical protein
MNSGMIVKSKSTDRFTSIDNEIIRNKNLDLDERGLLIFLLSMKSDWVVYKTTLHNLVGCSKGTLDRVFKGLQSKGYIVSIKVINELGRFDGWNHIVYDNPAIRDEQSPITSNAEVGQSAPISNTDINNKTIYKKTKFIRPTISEVSDYAKEIGFLTLDAGYFIDHYESNGWLVGKNKMQDWKAAIRTWKRNECKYNTKTNQQIDSKNVKIKGL